MVISKNWKERYHQRSRAKISKVKNKINQPKVKNEITNESQTQSSRTISKRRYPKVNLKSSRMISRTKILKGQKFKNDIKNEKPKVKNEINQSQLVKNENTNPKVKNKIKQGKNKEI